MHGPAKAEAVAALAARRRARPGPLRRLQRLGQRSADAHRRSGEAVAVNPDSELLREARQHGWEIRDFRTGRKAVKIAVPSTAAAGIVAGAVTAGLAARRRRLSK